MPYIRTNRIKIDKHLNSTIDEVKNTGDLNYCIYKLCKLWVKREGINYENLSNCIKTFECAKLEFYRMILVPYENKKIEENGNVEPVFDFEKK